jgi:hypothetical protein
MTKAELDALRVRVAELAANPDADALERIEAQERLIDALDHAIENPGKVLIRIRRGIASIDECPDGLDVEIRDYDTDFANPEDLGEDEEGEYINRGD